MPRLSGQEGGRAGYASMDVYTYAPVCEHVLCNIARRTWKAQRNGQMEARRHGGMGGMGWMGRVGRVDAI